MINILFFVLCLVTSSASQSVHGIQNTLKEDLELERQLKLLNKPPVKSIHMTFGDIVDCIDINKQPAFDHPLLKDHKLQRKPSFQKSNGKKSVKNSPTRAIFGLENDKCPTGTIPIRRTKKDDLIRGKSLLNYHIMTQDIPGVHLAEVSLLSKYGPYYGVNGTNSIYNLKVSSKYQITASHIWVQNGPIDASNKIAAGWHVAPALYGDNLTHLYSAWTSDNFKKTGCYNIRCPGFVQVNAETYLGRPVYKTSVYGGVSMEFAISIYQDQVTKNWWLDFEDTHIGYFPAALFSNMASADEVGWGGRTRTPPRTNAISPPMGSGYFPDDDFSQACYFRHVSVQNASRHYYGPEQYQIQNITDNSNCFGAKYFGYHGSKLGYCLQFGGPGGHCGN